MASFSGIKIRWETRMCTVNGEPGYFHTWEQWSKPVDESILIGGAPAGVISTVFGIVEFADGIQRVDPANIKFCDEEHGSLVAWKEFLEGKDKNDEHA